MVLITKDFNSQFSGPFFKWINDDGKTRQNRDYTFTLGLNTIDNFKPEGECSPGGLYFTEEKYLEAFTKFGNNLFKVTIPNDAFVWVEERKVIIPGDAFVWVEERKFKTNKMIIEKLTDIEYSNYIHIQPKLLQFVKEQTPEICMSAVQQNGLTLQYAKKQFHTVELCMSAVQQNGMALQFVKDQTPEMCMAAVKQDGYTLQFVKEPSSEVSMAAVKQNGWALQFVKNPSSEVIMAAVKQNGMALKFVKDPSLEVSMAAVQ